MNYEQIPHPVGGTICTTIGVYIAVAFLRHIFGIGLLLLGPSSISDREKRMLFIVASPAVTPREDATRNIEMKPRTILFL